MSGFAQETKVSGFAYDNKFTDEEWAEISQEIPKQDDEFLRKYVEGRQNLIEQENKQRSGTVHLALSQGEEFGNRSHR